MQLFSRFLPISCFVALSAQAGLAQSLYVEGNIGVDQPDIFEAAGAGDINIPTLGLRTGYQFSKHWSVEGDLQIGLEEDDPSLLFIDADGEAGLNAAAGVFVRGSIPLMERLSAHIRAGAAVSEYETQIVGSSTGELTNDYSGLALGAGAEFDLTEDFYLRTDYTLYETPGSESGAFTIGAGVKF